MSFTPTKLWNDKTGALKTGERLWRVHAAWNQVGIGLVY